MKRKVQTHLPMTKTLPRPVKAKTSSSKAEDSVMATVEPPNQGPGATPAIDPQSTPMPFETLATFYARTCEYWATHACEAAASSTPAMVGGSGAGRVKPCVQMALGSRRGDGTSISRFWRRLKGFLSKVVWKEGI
jgi:hypothetical protein